MVKQKVYTVQNNKYWVQNARGKPYQVYLGRGVRKTLVKKGRTVEINFHNHKGYIEGVCIDES